MQLRPHNFQLDSLKDRFSGRHKKCYFCPDCGLDIEVQYGYNEPRSIEVVQHEAAGGLLCCGSPEARAELERQEKDRGILRERFEATSIEIDEVLEAHLKNRSLYNDLTFVYDTDYIKFGDC